jgi:diguanylate cyclase (GGDEF)-like protein
MDERIKTCIAKGYEVTKKMIDYLDVHKITNRENFMPCYHEIEVTGTYYKREYEETMPIELRDKETYFKSTYSVIKTLMHLRYISINNDEANKIYDGGKSLPRGLRYANELFCWNVVYHIYELYIKAKNAQRPVSTQEKNKWPPFCKLHFVKTKNSVVTTFFRSRNRLSDISPGYIALLFELLTQRHKNISAELVGKLLNRSGFITYLTFWGQKTATIGLMYCDLDKFKQVNDDNSHEVGDMILRKVAAVLSAICEKYNGIPARVGGEEFWLAFKYTDQNVDITQELTKISMELRQELQKIKRPNPKTKCISKGEYKKYMTMSVAGGIAPMPNGFDHKNIGGWFDQLDKVVQSIKKSGRDKYKFVQLS